MHTVVRTLLLVLIAATISACSVLPAPEVTTVDAQTVASTDVVTIAADDPTPLTIRGAGFGDRQGVSRLFYGGIEVPSSAIADWSDGAIELAYLQPQEIVGGASLGAKSTRLLASRDLGGPTYVAPEDQRFEVRTLGGSVTSDPVRLVTVEMWLCCSTGVGQTSDVEVTARDLFGVSVPDLELELASSRGTLDATSLLTDLAGRASTTVTIESALPHAVRASFEGRSVAQEVVLPYTLDPSSARVTPGVATTVDLRLVDRADVPSAAANLDLEWRLFVMGSLTAGLYDLGTTATDSEGTASVPLPALPYGMTHRLVAVQDGYVVGESYVHPDVAPLE